jgi:hypothetical protein
MTNLGDCSNKLVSNLSLCVVEVFPLLDQHGACELIMRRDYPFLMFRVTFLQAFLKSVFSCPVGLPAGELVASVNLFANK